MRFMPFVVQYVLAFDKAGLFALVCEQNSLSEYVVLVARRHFVLKRVHGVHDAV